MSRTPACAAVTRSLSVRGARLACDVVGVPATIRFDPPQVATPRP